MIESLLLVKKLFNYSSLHHPGGRNIKALWQQWHESMFFRLYNVWMYTVLLMSLTQFWGPLSIPLFRVPWQVCPSRCVRGKLLLHWCMSCDSTHTSTSPTTSVEDLKASVRGKRLSILDHWRLFLVQCCSRVVRGKADEPPMVRGAVLTGRAGSEADGELLVAGRQWVAKKRGSPRPARYINNAEMNLNWFKLGVREVGP